MQYEDLEYLWEEGIEHPLARKLAKEIGEADPESDWQFGGDGDNGEQLILALTSVFRARDRAVKLLED